MDGAQKVRPWLMECQGFVLKKQIGRLYIFFWAFYLSVVRIACALYVDFSFLKQKANKGLALREKILERQGRSSRAPFKLSHSFRNEETISGCVF